MSCALHEDGTQGFGEGAQRRPGSGPWMSRCRRRRPGGLRDLLEGQLRGPGAGGSEPDELFEARGDRRCPAGPPRTPPGASASTALTMIVAMRAAGAAPGSSVSFHGDTVRGHNPLTADSPCAGGAESLGLIRQVGRKSGATPDRGFTKTRSGHGSNTHRTHCMERRPDRRVPATPRWTAPGWATSTSPGRPAPRQSEGKTSPEELIAAAHSACFSMAFSLALARPATPLRGQHQGGCHLRARHRHHRQPPDRQRTDPRAFPKRNSRSIAEEAKVGCPVSGALAGIEITLDATLAAS